MPFCPNCGSYVSPGDNTCMCGTYVGGDEEAIELENKTSEIFSKYDRLKEKHSNYLYYGLEKEEYLDRCTELLNDFKDLKEEIDSIQIPFECEYPFSSLTMDLNRDISNLDWEVDKISNELDELYDE